MQRDVKAIVDGTLGGAGGTLAMSAVMVIAEKFGLLGEHPPELITAKALDAVGRHDHAEETQDILAVALHFGFGIAVGALFGLLHRRLPVPLPSALHGVLFAVLVWAVSYKGWVPALGIMPPTERDRPGRPAIMLLAHCVFGWVLGTIVGRR